MTFDEAFSYLLSLGHETLTIKLGLKNIEQLLDELGNPHREYAAVQIAGTNGKGSTAAMLEAICRAGEIRVGLFTSPHLISIIERIRVEGQPISETAFAKFTNEVRTTAEDLLAKGRLETLPTFFEHVTAIALLAFREAKVELAILETGLGGRLDSTTAAGADIVAITPIAMDHQEYLGTTLAEIAGEKAAIIRPGVTAIVSPQTDAALQVVLRRCKDVGVSPHPVREEIISHAIKSETESGAAQDARLTVTFKTPSHVYENVSLGLRGRHQVENAATAIALAEALRERGFPISQEAIVDGLENARHPGRLELWPGEPRILFDGAHNPASAQAFRNYLDEFVKEPVTMIFGAMQDKALKEMAAILFPVARELVLTQMENPRAASLEMLQAAVPESHEVRIHHATSVDQALRIANEVTPREGVACVTGSLYLVGEAQQILRDSLSVAQAQPSH